ncbi:MAG: ArsR/SmtB family transcription factor [Caulobacteraceae bacterium]
MKLPNEKVSFTVHPPVEFVYALNFIANEGPLYKQYQEYNFSPSEDFRMLIDEMKGKLSKYLQSELVYFFGWQDMLHIMGRIILENDKIKTVPDFIGFIGEISEKELLSYIMRQVLWRESSFSESLACWNDCEHITGNIKQLISDMDDKSDEEKEKLGECVDNPSEIKSRLHLLMTQFYEKCYKSIEGRLLKESELAKLRYEKLFLADPEYFYREFLNKFSEFEHKELVIHVSYFTQIRLWLFLMKPHNQVLWVSLGIYTEHYPRKVFITSRVQKFVKLLSDKKRFEIVELLGRKPHYVYELAAELELTPPTVSYHLNALSDLNLVYVERNNNKTYYSLNREAVSELLENAAEILLKK